MSSRAEVALRSCDNSIHRRFLRLSTIEARCGDGDNVGTEHRLLRVHTLIAQSRTSGALIVKSSGAPRRTDRSAVNRSAREEASLLGNVRSTTDQYVARYYSVIFQSHRPRREYISEKREKVIVLVSLYPSFA